ncbi:MAG: hypothetical protein A2045_12995 [Rhodocyclales bacterium GWA2_65_20]|nr:MAG: hypothetical protein A2045_12995 [Rhodocyclales bacterium GWA2_65_20]
MNYKLIYSALRARYRLFVLILATTLLATIAISLIMPKTYIAKGSLLLNGKDEQSLRTANGPEPWDRAGGYVRTQLDIVTSSKVAHRAVADLKLADNPSVREAFEDSGSPGSIEDWLVEKLLRDIKVDTSQGSPVQQSSVVRLSFAADDANYAAQVVNAFAKAYVDTVLELRVEPTRQTSLWFDEQMKVLRDNMEQAERRLTDFQQEHGIVGTDDRFDAENVLLSDLATQIARARVPNAQVADISNLPGGLASPAIQTVKSELMRAEAKLQQMSAELGGKHPQYLRQQAEVQALRAKLGSEIGIVVSDAKTAARNSRAHVDQLLAAMKAQQQRILGLKKARNELALLSHDVDIAQKTYDTAMQRFMASKIESRALQTNVAVLDQAVPPASPARPKLVLNAAIALVLGAMLGLAAAFLLEMSDRRVRWLDDLAADPQVPLLAVLNTWDPAAERLLGTSAPRHALPNPG